MLTSILHSRSLISLLCVLLLLHAHLYFTSSKLCFYTSFASFALCPLPFCILETSSLHFVYSICSCSLLFYMYKASFSILFALFAPCPPLFGILKASFVCFVYSLCSLSTSIFLPQSFVLVFRLLSLLPMYLYFTSLNHHLTALFVPFVPCPPPFCILKSSFLYFICFLCSLPTSILHPQCFISLLRLFPLLPVHLYFISSKLHLFISFVPFVPCLRSFFFFKTSFVYFVCFLCTLFISILHHGSFISLLHLVSLLTAHLHFASSKLYFSALFAPFVLYPPPFCILEASFLCFVCSLCSLPTFILPLQNFILFSPCPPPFYIFEASFLCFVCSICSLPTSILHPGSFISLFRLLYLLPANIHFKKKTWL
jgi:hypothetical protein